MQCAIFHAERDDTGTFALIIHQQIKGKILDMEMRLMFQTLLIECMQNGMPRPIGRSAGAAGHGLAIIKSMATERPLINLTLIGTRERHAVILQLDHRRNCVPAHIFDGILITEPVRPLDRVIHMILPIVALAHIIERGAYAALCGYRVRAGWEYLGDTSCF